MGTRSTIALEFADGSVQQVYCHWDGYLEHNGEILAKHYMDPFKVKALVERGGMSTLTEEVDNCAFYTQRGEELTVESYRDVAEYFKDGQQEEYDYILRNVEGVATWFVRYYDTRGQWITLDRAFVDSAVAEDN